MELYVHFGLYKAGSSYLQYVCTNSRDALLEQGVWFPFSVEDAKMKLGLISAGNGDQLAQALGSGDRAKLQQYMSSWAKEASAKSCTRILISTEAIVHHFTQRDKLVLLEQAAHAAGITGIKTLGFFRDLLSHALSTYKHRAASGRYPDYDSWLRHHYETPTVLKQFLAVYTNCTFEWTFRKFKKDSNHLFTAFFNDWLEVKLSNAPLHKSVNESLTLSEISMISALTNCSNHLLANALSKSLRHLPGQKKASDQDLQALFLHRAALILEEHNTLLQAFNTLLPENEKLFLVEKSDEMELLSGNARYSQEQMQVVAHTATQLIGWKGLRRQFYQYLVVLIPQRFRKKIVQQRYAEQAKKMKNARG